MSRIQMILDKAEREGTTRRFRNDLRVADNPDVPPPASADAPAPHVARTVTAPFEPVTPLAPVDAVGTVAVPVTSPDLEPSVDEVEATEAVAPQATRTAQRLPVAPALVAALHPNALTSEQFRTLRTRIANSANGRGARALLFTSPGRGEGKSVMAANLAITMGQEIQQRVCLVDASLRDASIHDLFGLPDSPGLVDVLNGEVTLDEALVTLDEYQLTVLPAGKLPRHPAELLAGREMRRLLDLLRSRFDRVIIDAPPALPMADVSILTPLVDGVLMVVRAGMTGTPDLQRALGSLDTSRVLGVVLNDLQA